MISFRSTPRSAGWTSDKINYDAGIIEDVIMVEEGEAKGHGVHLEAEFIRDLVAYDHKQYGDRGVKARLGHPNMCNDAMGTQIGYFRNYRTRKSPQGQLQAIADLHLLEAANTSPEKPGARDWILKMAEEAPDFIMSSIVFRPGGFYQRKSNGHKVVLEIDDKWGVPISDPALGAVYVEFGDNGRHMNTDLVEDGAATESLFSSEANTHLFAVQAENFLKDNPQLQQFIHNNPDKVRSFLNRIGLGKKLLTTMDIENPIVLSQKALEDLADRAAQKATDSLSQKIDSMEQQVKSFQQEVDSFKKAVERLNEELSAAKTKLEELEAEPADKHTSGEKDSGEKKPRSWESNPVFQKAKNMRK